MAELQNGSNSTKPINLKVTRSPPVILHPSGEVPAGGGATYFLSNLDQNLVVTMKTIYCYPATGRRSTENAGEVLRTALEKVLVYFYPFDGRFGVDGEGKLVVRMEGGGGVPFVEATAECEMEELGDLSVPAPEKLGVGLVYCPPAESIFEMPLLTVQVTRFTCGGFAVGMAMTHSLADGISAVQFLHSWAEISRNLPLSLTPFLDRSLLSHRLPPAPEFPHPEFSDLSPSLSSPSSSSSLPLIHKAFTFDTHKLARLKLLASAANGVTAFSALTGLVWRARTKALNTPSTDPTKLLFAVDGRNRLDPPLPAGFFGNGIVFACCVCPAGELLDMPLAHAVRMIQTAARGVTDRFIRSAIDYYEMTRARPSLAGTLVVTAWTRLGFGATDFGWGSAAQTGPAELPSGEVALFLPERNGGKGTVVVIGLPASAMCAFEEMMENV